MAAGARDAVTDEPRAAAIDAVELATHGPTTPGKPAPDSVLDEGAIAREAWAAAERAISRAEGLQRVAAALGRALRTDEVAEVALREGLQALGAGRGVVGLLEPDGHTIRTVREVGFRPRLLQDWPSFDVNDEMPLAEAIRLRGPVILSGAELVQRYPTLPERVTEGGPAVVVPLIYEDRTLGGLYFRYLEASSIEDADKGYFAALGRQCAAALERARLYEAETVALLEAATAQRRIGFLAQVGEALGQAPDIEVALSRIAAIAVPEIADWAAVFLVEPDRSIHLLSLNHRDPERIGSVRALLEARPPNLDDARGAGAAIRTGEVEIVTDYPGWIESQDVPRDARETIDQTGIRSVMHCPLQGDTSAYGVLTLATTGDRLLTDADASFGTELGRRVGTALEKVQLDARLRDRLDQIRDRDERLELALAASRTGFWEWNMKSGRFLWSDEICRLHGMPLGTQLPSLDAYLQLVHPDDRDRVRTEIEEAFVSGVFDTEYRIVLPGGRVRWMRDGARVFLAPDRQPVRMIGIGQDITERREVEQERERLLDSERRAGELGQVFIGVVSHELRTPITMILGGAQLLRRLEGSSNLAQRAELTADIEAEAERLYRLTEDLLVLTRVERGGLELGSEPVLLRRLLEQVVASESERWPGSRITLSADLDLPLVLGDGTYVEQLARNLVGNAAKYSGPEGEIRVVAEAADEEVQVRVLDNGPGLPEGDLDRIFELFYRSPSTSKKVPGAGIGLFVCSTLAKAMGGRVWAGNRETRGSEFGFALRRYGADELEPVSTPRADTSPVAG